MSVNKPEATERLGEWEHCDNLANDKLSGVLFQYISCCWCMRGSTKIISHHHVNYDTHTLSSDLQRRILLRLLLLLLLLLLLSSSLSSLALKPSEGYGLLVHEVS
jgi:hypothetical protein